MITCTLCFFIGTDRPDLRYLHRCVIPDIYAHWYEIGLELLDVDKKLILEHIRPNNPDTKSCTAEMLQFWLQSRVDASWNELIQALRQPGIGLSVLALKIENMLVVKEEDISFKGIITIM